MKKVFKRVIAASLAVCMCIEGIGISTVKADVVEENGVQQELISEDIVEKNNIENSRSDIQFNEWVENVDYRIQYDFAPDECKSATILILKSEYTTEELDYNIQKIVEKIRIDNPNIRLSEIALVVIGALIGSIIAPIILEDLVRPMWNEIKNGLKNIATKEGWINYKYGSRTYYSYRMNYNSVRNKWIKSNDEWYWMMDDGVMFDPSMARSSWIKIGNFWYFFNKSAPSNKTGMLNKIEGWYKYNGKWMYFKPGASGYGAYYSTTISINNEKFTFDANGYCVKGRGC